MSEEQWRPVRDFEGLYEVSDHGRVRRHFMNHVGPVRGWLNEEGRPKVNLRGNGKRRMVYIHTLVLEAFVGARPPGMMCCHGDGNPANNHLSNLRWDTRSANTIDSVRHGVHNMARIRSCPRGHEYDEINTVIYKGKRYCRTCSRKRPMEAQPRYERVAS